MFKAPVPAKLPHLHSLLANIGLPDDKVARFLGVSPNSVRHWRKLGQAPRPVMLALFWESAWGRSAANCDAVNWGRLQFQENVMLKRKLASLQRKIERLEKALAERDQAANSPFFEVNHTGFRGGSTPERIES